MVQRRLLAVAFHAETARVANLMHPICTLDAPGVCSASYRWSRRTCSLQGFLESGARGTRTPDLLGAIQALSQLSYSPVKRRMPRDNGGF